MVGMRTRRPRPIKTEYITAIAMAYDRYGSRIWTWSQARWDRFLRENARTTD
jgi:hypothetical protein